MVVVGSGVVSTVVVTTAVVVSSVVVVMNASAVHNNAAKMECVVAISAQYHRLKRSRSTTICASYATTTCISLDQSENVSNALTLIDSYVSQILCIGISYCSLTGCCSC